MKRYLSGSPHTLAAFRIAVSLALLLSGELHDAARVALALDIRVAPEGLGWFMAWVPITEASVRAAHAVAIAGAIATMLGLYTRWASALLALAAFYLLAVGQLSGTVIHDMHLVWFAAILAVSPSGDVWSLDDWWLRREGELPSARARPSGHYAVAIWTARLLFACIYFFPGLWKLATQGLGWALSDNLAYQLYWKWFEWGAVPTFRLDRHPTLLAAGGLAVLAFEVGFPLLLATRATRVVAAGIGLCFHLASDRWFRIPFSSLWICYPVLFDIMPAPTASGSRPTPPHGKLEILVCASLLVGAVVQGARAKTDAFPFACYPTFQHHPPRDISDLRIVGVAPDGTTFDVPHARDERGVRSQMNWGRIWALAGVTQPVSEERLLAYAASALAARPQMRERAQRLDVFRAQYSVVPEARSAPPTAEVRLASFPIERVNAALRLPHPTN